MKNIIFKLMLGTAILTASPVLAMDETIFQDKTKSYPLSPQTLRSYWESSQPITEEKIQERLKLMSTNTANEPDKSSASKIYAIKLTPELEEEMLKKGTHSFRTYHPDLVEQLEKKNFIPYTEYYPQFSCFTLRVFKVGEKEFGLAYTNTRANYGGT